MNILAMDTSNQVLAVAIQRDNKVVGEIVTNLAKNHSVRLMPAIDRLMKEVNMKPEQLEKVIVAKGPGSYTGVRIGLATAKTMAWALNIPVIGVSSLEVLAYQGRFFNGVICPFFDARRGLVYTGCYRWDKNTMKLIRKEENLAMDILLSELSSLGQQVIFLSPDIAIHQEQIKGVLGDLAIIPEEPDHLLRGAHLIAVAKGKQPEPTHTLRPNYLRLAEAEAKWLEKNKGC
ncbi:MULTISPECIES: tRNA (adenosine(37)-N6)-threonylcarbamoyltransferase complex dimerization subunit type 1 TsaB [Clostridia]|uniref:tRNA (adenosine(37)-N6)-threonylcarbamoyltransferase complex dimerization subunit type 1 TsaB n=1 Tax=Clostridia TaxID=186801 RepID=UPI000EA3426E|nr:MULTISPECIES: tRNA (adenosine(37)-N6)-threonylcarbamoyltransferase complex dimerization subunit type 1 TsaB [Clostridia]NBJ71564.1 tRNA (adenosine(37)-N6)-threonylcarbamoyltransferase complex dimerization subunit type 1 TsaB [Roseburia sp. 1XD42-34]RKI74164.1 tRNA (adenosine(37)-N6)-threonylcarbamoyltransferase complex dimerization subunit type 1 TsaB [Clostridium sp. 1xD42-85]